MITITDQNRQEVLERWARELETTDVQQGHKYLCYEVNGQRYQCCLGVLYDVVEPDGWVKTDQASAMLPEGAVIFARGDGEDKFLSDSLANGLGVYMYVYVSANDMDGRSFRSIANMIRSGEGIHEPS